MLHLFQGIQRFKQLAIIQYLPYNCGLWWLLENSCRLSVEVMSAVGQGGERCCTLLYSLRLLPERLQAVAPGCSNFALATWIHRHTDPWLTLQVALSGHTIQYCTISSSYFKVSNPKWIFQGYHVKVAYHLFGSLVSVLTKKYLKKTRFCDTIWSFGSSQCPCLHLSFRM